MTKKDVKKLKVTQNSMERSILRVKKRDKVKISTIKNKLSWGNDFVWAAKRMKWDWAGHVARQDENRWTYKVKNWYLREGRKRGKQKMRWEDEIIDFLDGYKMYHRVAYDRREWSRLREAYARYRAL